jgi:hypothetical protein
VFEQKRGVWVPLSPPPSLRGGIQRFCGSKTPIFHCAGHEETKAKGSHWVIGRATGRWIGRGWHVRSRRTRRNGGKRESLVIGRATGRWIGRGWHVRSAHPACRGSSAHTGAFGRSRDRHVRSCSREVVKHARSIGRGGASGHDQPDASDRVWVLTGINWTLALWHPVSSSNASGRVVSNAIQW